MAGASGSRTSQFRFVPASSTTQRSKIIAYLLHPFVVNSGGGRRRMAGRARHMYLRASAHGLRTAGGDFVSVRIAVVDPTSSPQRTIRRRRLPTRATRTRDLVPARVDRGSHTQQALFADLLGRASTDGDARAQLEYAHASPCRCAAGHPAQPGPQRGRHDQADELPALRRVIAAGADSMSPPARLRRVRVEVDAKWTRPVFAPVNPMSESPCNTGKVSPKG
jgi:hypothetical protein